MSNLNNLIVIAGPPGLGKSYLVKYLTIQYPMSRRVLAITTRKKLPGHIDNLDYRYVTDEEYVRMRNVGKFIIDREKDIPRENGTINIKNGFTKDSITEVLDSGLTPIVDTHDHNVEDLKHAFPYARAIFFKPESEELLVSRMILRSETTDVIDRRLQDGLKELANYERHPELYDACYTINETNLDETVKAIAQEFLPKESIRGEGNSDKYTLL